MRMSSEYLVGLKCRLTSNYLMFNFQEISHLTLRSKPYARPRTKESASIKVETKSFNNFSQIMDCVFKYSCQKMPVIAFKIEKNIQNFFI